MIDYVNKAYLATHTNSTIRVEMGSFYHDKRHQIWLWWAVDHESGEAISFLVWEEGTKKIWISCWNC
jgi:IS1 family transposase